ncbi:MAG: gamma carbonic anhydrase family protein [Candidatus Ancaeobacter aquaticus]|nr:gamma carbonic anhydrase family protein [Candidatus Ancaeobacter aquaticus]
MNYHIHNYNNRAPSIHSTCFIAHGVVIVGDVKIAKDVSIWYNSVLRADVNKIIIGEKTNIQDSCIVHVGHNEPCIIGREVTIGHGVNLHGCTIKDNAVIGIGSIILSGAIIGEGAIIAAGSIVPEGMRVKEKTLVMGQPARFVREINERDVQKNSQLAAEYVALKNEYM